MVKKKSLYRAVEILPLFLVGVLLFSAICLAAASKEMVLRYDGEEKIVTTILEDPRAIFEEQGIKVGKEDSIVEVVSSSAKPGQEVLEVRRALPITIAKHGDSTKIYSSKETVGEVLASLAINHDGKIVYPAVETPVTADMQVHILSRFDEITEEEQAIEAPVEFIDDHEKAYGETEVLEPGAPGKVKVVSKTTLKDGFLQTEVIDRHILTEPKKSVIKRGMARSVETSRGRMRYSKIMTMEISAYTLGEGAGTGLTSIGIAPYEGIVAVDPRVIPYYTKMYIPGYGIAMAGDTGGSIRGNKLDVFMHDWNRAIQWGRRTLDVYILE